MQACLLTNTKFDMISIEVNQNNIVNFYIEGNVLVGLKITGVNLIFDISVPLHLLQYIFKKYMNTFLIYVFLVGTAGSYKSNFPNAYNIDTIIFIHIIVKLIKRSLV